MGGRIKTATVVRKVIIQVSINTNRGDEMKGGLIRINATQLHASDFSIMKVNR